MEIRLLTEADNAIYWDLRLLALKEEPTAFASDYESTAARSYDDRLEQFRRSLTTPGEFMLGAFDEDQLIGMVKFGREVGPKLRHNAHVYGMYVAPVGRGKGAGKALLDELIERARAMDGLSQIFLEVTATNSAARNLYLSRGFQIYGRTPRIIQIGETYYDEDLMILKLD